MMDDEPWWPLKFEYVERTVFDASADGFTRSVDAFTARPWPTRDISVTAESDGSYVVRKFSWVLDDPHALPGDPDTSYDLVAAYAAPDELTLRCVLMSLSKGDVDAL